jgi:hypothetical protein
MPAFREQRALVVGDGELHPQARARAGWTLEGDPTTGRFHPIFEADEAGPRAKSAPPRPSSWTETRRTRSRASTLSDIADACACFAAFANASETT